jgi:hypothetical protein
MHASTFLSVLACGACAYALGCGGAVVQPGLANAPIPGTPETRVHDAIANGPDACERAMFPQGEVLRGHLPPCSKESSASAVGAVPTAAAVEAPLSRLYPACPASRPALTWGMDRSLMAFPFSPPPWWLGCDNGSFESIDASHLRAP